MSMKASVTDLRESLLATTRKLAAIGLNRGSSGNVSVRHGDGLLITPSGLPSEQLQADDMVSMGLDGRVYGTGKPSSEWRFHVDILSARPEVHAVVHTHSTYATTLACMRLPIPALHYMIALAGGDDIRCADYALFGSQALSDTVLLALQDRKACLLANHGVIALGETLDQAVAIAVEVEHLAELYVRCLQLGKPCLLDTSQMQAVHEKFAGYGQWRNALPSAADADADSKRNATIQDAPI